RRGGTGLNSLGRASDSQFPEEIGGIFGLMHFYVLRGFAHGLSREFVGFQVEGESFFIGDSGENDAHYVGDGKAHLFEHSGGSLLDISANSGADNGICGHGWIVAHLGYKCEEAMRCRAKYRDAYLQPPECRKLMSELS
ncbi:MAG TPA: hypothetical protein VMV39_08560, partial [Terracidiphilus sp.]|nr:hypothetical protein [Terracidiphilus sp.]